MEHIAFNLKKDPLAVRMANAIKTGDTILAAEEQKFAGENLIPRMIEELKISGSIEKRQKFIDDFNSVCKHFMKMTTILIIIINCSFSSMSYDHGFYASL